jgi:alkanesulfonate monooxygenase SsuD/methylene tetrahydromethanopterin reductase-like flavin-dependent oxidoreductase (luciferase family)
MNQAEQQSAGTRPPIAAMRFGVTAAPQTAEQWLATARRAEQLGYSTLVMADGMQLPSPLPALALAAGATTRLRVGTFVLAAPLHAPALAAWDAHTLSLLSGGRFELGLGTGRPEVVRQAVDRLGEPELSAAARLQRVARTIDELRTLDDEHHTPVMIAVGGPRGLRLAAEHADIVTFALGPLAPREELAAQVTALREAAPERAIEIAHAVPVVGDQAPPWIERIINTTAAELRKRDSLAWLPAEPDAMRDELDRRHEQLGISYTIINATYMEQVAPTIKDLARR